MCAEPQPALCEAGGGQGTRGPRTGLATGAVATLGVCTLALAAASYHAGELGGFALGLTVAVLAAALAYRRHTTTRQQLATAERRRAALDAQLAEATGQLATLDAQLCECRRLAAVGTMSAHIAHQLRNPLTSIQLYLQLLADIVGAPPDESSDDASSTSAKDLLDLVLQEVKVLVDITDNYLQYARLPDLRPAPVDVNRTVGDLVRFLRPGAQREGIAVSLHLADGLPEVSADSRLLRLALMNLLRNAVEAMAEGGRLRVKTCRQNGAVAILVSDTGPGIAPADTDRIFEPFFSTKESGAGLGLSLTRQVVAKHGGVIDCESMMGMGTTFVVRLPVAAAWKAASSLPATDKL